jgi:TPR repeat protein
MRHFIFHALAWLSVLFFENPVFAQDNPDKQLFQAQEQLAKKGRPDAQYYLGEMYEHGLGTTQNLDNAFKWYKKSADQGNRLAKRKLAKHDEIVGQHARDAAEELAAEQAQQHAKVVTTSNVTPAVAVKQSAEAAEKQRLVSLSKRANRQAAVRALLIKMEGQPEAFE